MSFDGINYLVVWQEFHSGSGDIYGTRVSRAGGVLDAGFAISNVPANQAEPALSFDGTNFFVVWADGRSNAGDIYGTRVSRAGVVLDPAGVQVSNGPAGETSPTIAFDGTNYLAVWQDGRHGTGDEIYGTRVTKSGSVLDVAGLLIATGAWAQFAPAVVFNSSSYVVTWTDMGITDLGDIFGARVSKAGGVLDPNGLLVSTGAASQVSPRVAFDGTNYLVVWQTFGSLDTDILATRVTPSGIVLDPGGIVVSAGAAAEAEPDVAFNGTNYLVVWDDNRVVGSDIYATRVSKAGVVQEPNGIPISTLTGSQIAPAVTSAGSNFLVVWGDSHSGASDIYGTRVGPTGNVVDPAGIAMSARPGTQSYPAVAFDGTNYLVAWQDDRTGSTLDIYASRVSTTGTVLNPTGIAVSTAPGAQDSPRLAFDGTNYLVVWQDLRSGVNHDVYASRVSKTGTVLNPTGIAVSTAPGDQRVPVVAFNGTLLVVWLDKRNGGPDDQVYGARVNSSGAVSDPSGFLVANTGGDQNAPAIVKGAGSTWAFADNHPTPGGNGIFFRTIAAK